MNFTEEQNGSLLSFANLTGGTEWPIPFPIPDFDNCERDPVTAALMRRCNNDPSSRNQLLSSYSLLKINILRDLVLEIHKRSKKVYPNGMLIRYITYRLE